MAPTVSLVTGSNIENKWPQRDKSPSIVNMEARASSVSGSPSNEKKTNKTKTKTKTKTQQN